MKPIVNRGSMSDLGQAARKKACKCSPQCKTFFTFTAFNDGMILCEGDAMQHVAEMNELLYGKIKPKKNEKLHGWWTRAEEMAIIRIANQFGKYDTGRYRIGVIPAIMEETGRTKNQIARKMYDMRAEGKL